MPKHELNTSNSNQNKEDKKLEAAIKNREEQTAALRKILEKFNKKNQN